MRFALLAAVFAIAAGCSPERDNVTAVDPEDDRMNAAIAGARASVDDFRAAVRSPPAGAIAFTVKKGFAVADDPEGLEHIWVNDVRLDGENFVGELGNEPVNDVGAKYEETVTVRPEDLSDWMYFVAPENGPPRLVGGFTMYAMNDILKGDELEAFRSSLPFDFSAGPVTK